MFRGDAFTGNVCIPSAEAGVINAGDLLAAMEKDNVIILTEFDHRNPGNVSMASPLPIDDLRTGETRTLRIEAAGSIFVNAPVV